MIDSRAIINHCHKLKNLMKQVHVVVNRRLRKVELHDKCNLCMVATTHGFLGASEEISGCEHVELASDVVNDKVLDMPTKHKIGANPILECIDFQRELLYLHNLGVSFSSNYNLQQISTELEKAKKLLPSANLKVVKSHNRK